MKKLDKIYLRVLFSLIMWMFSRPAFHKLVHSLIIANLEYLSVQGEHNRIKGLQFITIKITKFKLIEVVSPRYDNRYIGFSIAGRKGKDPIYRTIKSPQISIKINKIFKKF